jgi:hypothetical protein
MSERVTLVFWALSISFVGSLPPGTLNLSVVNYMSHHNQIGALYFAIAAIVVEMVIVGVWLIALEKIERLKRFYKPFVLFMCLLLLAIITWTTLASVKTMQPGGVDLSVISPHPVIVGLLISIANPLHLPFWMGWTAVLRTKSILHDNRSSYTTFVVSIGIGTALAFVVYGLAGHYATGVLGRYQGLLNWTMSITLLVVALTQLYKSILGWKKQHAPGPVSGSACGSGTTPE